MQHIEPVRFTTKFLQHPTLLLSARFSDRAQIHNFFMPISSQLHSWCSNQLHLGSYHRAEDTRVDKLILQDQLRWNIDLLRVLFEENDVNAILQIPLSIRDMPDYIGWQFTATSLYSVNSGYRLALQLQSLSPPPSSNIWNDYWSLDIPPKIQNFLLHACKYILPTRPNLHHRTIIQELHCLLYNSWVEHHFSCSNYLPLCQGNMVPCLILFRRAKCSYFLSMVVLAKPLLINC